MRLALMIVAIVGLAVTSSAQTQPPKPGSRVSSFYDLKTTTLLGKPADLGMYRGKVTLVVNVASYCGFTPQYKGLEALHRELKGKGFNVLGFPSNDFGDQEPGTAAEIATFTTRLTLPLYCARLPGLPSRLSVCRS